VFGQAFYANGTTFGGFVEVPGTMSPEHIKLMEDSLNEKHGGPERAFKVRVIAQGMKVASPSMPMTDAQFLESRKFSVTEVARWFRVPPHKIADLDRSTNNNIEHQSIEFVTDTVMPWLARLEQEANIKLIGARAAGSVYTKFAVNALMRGDSKARAEFYRAMVSMGAMSINEVRALEELNSVDAGDEHLVQLNQTTLKRLVEDPPEPKATNPEPAPAVEPDPEPDNVIRQRALDFVRGQRKTA
jgi:HK97 family phage portal protein